MLCKFKNSSWAGYGGALMGHMQLAVCAHLCSVEIFIWDVFSQPTLKALLAKAVCFHGTVHSNWCVMAVYRQTCTVRREYVGHRSTDLRVGDEFKRRTQQVNWVSLLFHLFWHSILDYSPWKQQASIEDNDFGFSLLATLHLQNVIKTSM